MPDYLFGCFELGEIFGREQLRCKNDGKSLRWRCGDECAQKFDGATPAKS